MADEMIGVPVEHVDLSDPDCDAHLRLVEFGGKKANCTVEVKDTAGNVVLDGGADAYDENESGFVSVVLGGESGILTRKDDDFAGKHLGLKASVILLSRIQRWYESHQKTGVVIELQASHPASDKIADRLGMKQRVGGRIYSASKFPDLEDLREDLGIEM